MNVDHPEGCDCGERWRHQAAAALARRLAKAKEREAMDRARRIGVARRNAQRLRHAREREKGDDA